MSKASEPLKQSRAQFVNTTVASCQMLHRNNRPDRRLHPTKTPNPQLLLQRGSHPERIRGKPSTTLADVFGSCAAMVYDSAGMLAAEAG
jgi:hypothetical protein